MKLDFIPQATEVIFVSLIHTALTIPIYKI